MIYSINMLTTVSDCSMLLSIANEEKADLNFRKLQFERQHGSVTTSAANIQGELAAVLAEISALETVVATLPPGPTRDQSISKLTKANYKKFLLEERKESYGVLVLLQKEYAISCIEKDIAETDAFIAAATVRMNEL